MNAFSNAAYMPALHRPPHDPRRIPLDGTAGWRVARHSEVVENQYGALQLAVEPGARRSLAEASGSFAGLQLPATAAYTADCGLLLLDSASSKLKKFDPCDCRFLEVPHTGGVGSDPRQFRNPLSIAIGGDNLFVADTGNHRLAVFSLLGYLLRAEWRPPADATPSPWQPVSVLVSNDRRVLVGDPANGSVHIFNFAGRWLNAITGLGAIRHLANDCENDLYIVGDESDPVRRYSLPTGQLLDGDVDYTDIAPRMPDPGIEVGASGVLNLGELCARYTATTDQPIVPAWFNLSGKRVKADKPVLPRFKRSGQLISEALDSGLYRCQWDRISMNVQVPEGTRVLVSTFAAESKLTIEQVQSLREDNWLTGQWIVPGDQIQFDWDCLIRSAPGRFLWLRISLMGDGLNTPFLCRAQVDFPRISLRRYLPAVFGEEKQSADFTDRFLAVFDRGFRQIESNIDNLAKWFDPLSAPAESGNSDFLSWLASWIGVTLDRQLPLSVRRNLVKNAGKMYPCIGTSHGVQKMLDLYLGFADRRCLIQSRCGPCTTKAPYEWVPPKMILEHFSLRRWLFVGAGQLGDRAKLWGQKIVNRSQLSGPDIEGNAQLGVTELNTRQDPLRDPFHEYAHKFSVFLPAWVSRLAGYRKTIDRVVAAAKPAHTQHDIVYVEPRMRVGIQAMIGIDAVIGCYPQGVVLDESRLGKASVLSEQDYCNSTLRIGGKSTIGSTTQLR